MNKGFLFLAVAIPSVACPVGQASAQGLFEFFFGGWNKPAAVRPQESRPPESGNSRVATRTESNRSHTRATGRGVAYCVRLCDGRFFPMQSHSRSAPEQLCNAFCPTSRTKVFLGSDIGKAVAADGTRYANLGTAFLYRDRIVADCTCNGKSNLGLASISIDADPTLRAGDVIVTAHGTVAATAKSATQTATGTADAPDARRSADALPRLASQARALSSQ